VPFYGTPVLETEDHILCTTYHGWTIDDCDNLPLPVRRMHMKMIQADREREAAMAEELKHK